MLGIIHYFCSVFEIQENDKYGIKFKASKQKMTLLIELDMEFPQSTPKLYVTIKNKNQVILIHPYIEDGFIKNAPGILNVSLDWEIKTKK